MAIQGESALVERAIEAFRAEASGARVRVHLSIDEKVALLPGIHPRRVVHETPWLSFPLVDTATAVLRLRAWAQSGGFDRPGRTAETIREQIAFYGDIEMLSPVVEAFERMAPCVREYVLDNAAVVSTGWSTSGWTSAARFSKAHDQVIVLSGAARESIAVRKVMLHEAAHVWLEEAPRVLAPAIGRQRFMHMARTEGWVSRVEEQINAEEARARALSAVWNEGPSLR